MPPHDKRPGRALGFGLPEPEAELDAASDKDRLPSINDDLQTIKAQLAEVLARSEKKKGGRPRDAYADAFNELSEIGVLVLRDAVEQVLEQAPPVNPEIMNQIVEAFEQGLVVAMKAAGKWHYEKQRTVRGDTARAGRNARRRRKKIKPSG